MCVCVCACVCVVVVACGGACVVVAAVCVVAARVWWWRRGGMGLSDRASHDHVSAASATRTTRWQTSAAPESARRTQAGRRPARRKDRRWEGSMALGRTSRHALQRSPQKYCSRSAESLM